MQFHQRDTIELKAAAHIAYDAARANTKEMYALKSRGAVTYFEVLEERDADKPEQVSVTINPFA